MIAWGIIGNLEIFSILVENIWKFGNFIWE